MTLYSQQYFDQRSLWERGLTQQDELRNDLVSITWPGDIKSVLEVGCGNGALLNYLNEECKCIGLDLSSVSLKHVRWPTVLADAARLPFDRHSFDLVIVSDILEHLTDPILGRVIDEIIRVCNRQLLVISPYCEDLPSQSTICLECGCHYHPNGHVRSFSRQDVEKMFDPAFFLQKYAYFGEPWREVSELNTSINLSLGYDLMGLRESICPQCGAKHNHSVELTDEVKAKIQMLNSNFQKLFQRKNKSIKHCEMMLWFGMEKVEKTNHGNQILINSSRDWDRKLRIDFTDPGELDMAECLSYIPNSVDRAWVILSENMDWGSLTDDVEGGVCRLLEDRQGCDEHSAFIFPTYLVNKRKCLHFGLRDQSHFSCFIQMYQPGRGYLDLGEIGGLGDGLWREASFDIPEKMMSGEPITIFRIVMNGISHPDNKIPIGQVYLSPKECVADERIIEYPYEGLDSRIIRNTEENCLLYWLSTLDGSEITIYGTDPDGKTAIAYLGRGSRVLIPGWYFYENDESTSSQNHDRDVEDFLGLFNPITHEQDLLLQIEQMNQVLTTYQERETEYTAISESLKNLQDDNNLLQEEKHTLESAIQDLKESIERLESQVMTLDGRYHGAQMTYQALKARYEDITSYKLTRLALFINKFKKKIS